MNPPVLADVAPPRELPSDAARAGLHGLLLAIGAGESLTTDRHRALKINNYDRLVFERMPVLCSGSLRVLHTWEMRGRVMLGDDLR